MNVINVIIAIVLLAVLALAYLFYDRFTRRGAIPLAKAWRDYTSWLCLLGIALAEYVVALLRYAADLWEPIQAQFGDLLANPSMSAFLQLISFAFAVAKLKGQAPFPRPEIPTIPS